MTDEEKSIDTSDDNFEDTFNDSEEEVSEEEKGEKPEDESQEEETEEVVEPPSATEIAGLKAALKANRQKAREAEALAKSLREKYEPDEEEPDPLIDPDAFKSYHRQKWEQEQKEKTVNRSRDRMMEKHSDYEEMEKVFMFLSNQDKSLVEEMWESPDPGQYAYDKAKEYRESEREAIRAELKEELAATFTEEKEGKPVSKKTPDLTTASALGDKTEKPESDVATLDEVWD